MDYKINACSLSHVSGFTFTNTSGLVLERPQRKTLNLKDCISHTTCPPKPYTRYRTSHPPPTIYTHTSTPLHLRTLLQVRTQFQQTEQIRQLLQLLLRTVVRGGLRRRPHRIAEVEGEDRGTPPVQNGTGGDIKRWDGSPPRLWTATRGVWVR